MRGGKITHGSLFSGIGGFDLAAQWNDWENIFQCEKDEWCRKVLAKNFPNTNRYEDIKEFNAEKYNGTIDVISGGFPCQPFSIAGKRKGKQDDRYLWAEMLRIIKEVQPKFVVGENVTGIIGMALDSVLSDLEAKNYTTETYIIPACGKNAWHRRDRVWIIAYTNNGRILRTSRKDEGTGKKKRLQKRDKMEQLEFASELRNEPIFPNTNGIGWEDCLHGQKQRGKASEFGNSYSEQYRNYWEVEPELGRVVDGLSRRVDRIKGLGNAIVPQVAYEIFNAIDFVLKRE